MLNPQFHTQMYKTQIVGTSAAAVIWFSFLLCNAAVFLHKGNFGLRQSAADLTEGTYSLRIIWLFKAISPRHRCTEQQSDNVG